MSREPVSQIRQSYHFHIFAVQVYGAVYPISILSCTVFNLKETKCRRFECGAAASILVGDTETKIWNGWVSRLGHF